MTYSQLRQYSSGDAGAPQLSGTVGSLLALLDAILIGTAGFAYGTTPSAGWTKPIANSGNVGCYTQGTGSSGCSLHVNDNGPGAGAGASAWFTGWRSLTALSATVGTGTGQFPTAAQLLTTGHVVVFKSSAASATIRDWIAFADAHTFHLLIKTELQTNAYQGVSFGDIFSFAPGVTDSGRCLIFGQTAETLGAAGCFVEVASNAPATTTGHYCATDFTGLGGSSPVGKHGDGSRLPTGGYLDGNNACPNPTDNAIYVAPVVIWNSSATRGQVRGLYHVCHSRGNFNNGQLIYGTGAYAGKQFKVITPIVAGSGSTGFCAIEVSATVETNS